MLRALRKVIPQSEDGKTTPQALSLTLFSASFLTTDFLSSVKAHTKDESIKSTYCITATRLQYFEKQSLNEQDCCLLRITEATSWSVPGRLIQKRCCYFPRFSTMFRASLSSSRLIIGGGGARVRQRQHIRRSALSSKSQNPSPKGNNIESLFSSALAWYTTKLDTHPITTNCFTSGLISGMGDLICQSLTISDKDISSEPKDHEKKWDIVRTSRFAVLGALWVGPVLHFWYGALNQALSKWVVARVMVDQFAFAPVFVTSFLSLLWTWEGESPSNLGPRLQENIPSIVVANWALWIPAQAVNFHFVPVKFHVLFSNFIALAWNVYLSYTSHESKPPNEVVL